MAKARRRRVPAFGEWNYNYHLDEPQAVAARAAACYATPEPEACSDVWFRYSPPPRKPTPKKQARRRAEGDVSRERSKASSEAAAAKSGGSRRVVPPVDGDLYQVPPPELASHRRPTKKMSLWNVDGMPGPQLMRRLNPTCRDDGKRCCVRVHR